MKKVFMAMAIVATMLAAASCACCNNSEENAECTGCVEETKAPCDSAKCAECDSTACCPNAQ